MRLSMRLGAIALAISACAHGSASAATFAVGTQYLSKRDNGSYDTRPLVLTRQPSGWLALDLGELTSKEAGVLVSIAKGDADTLWAMGQSEVGTTLWKSVDGGISWKDVSNGLPSDAQHGLRGRSLAVGADGAAWLLASDLHGVGPYLFRTTDGARTWAAIDTKLDKGMGPFVLTSNRSGSGAFMVRGDGNDPRVLQLPPAGAPKAVDRGAMRVLASTSDGQRVWLAGATFDSATLTTTPRILETSDNIVWSERAVLDGDAFEPRVISFTPDRAVGLVCGGVGPELTMRPGCFHSPDGGTTWQPAQLPTPTQPYTILAAGMVDRTTGYAIAMKLGGPGSLFFETTDGGATWQRTETAYDNIAHIRALVAQ